jgi:hypothetical protein
VTVIHSTNAHSVICSAADAAAAQEETHDSHQRYDSGQFKMDSAISLILLQTRKGKSVTGVYVGITSKG